MLIDRILASLFPESNPERARTWLFLAQLALVGGFAFFYWWLRNREQPSGFRIRESDRIRPASPGASHPLLGAPGGRPPGPPEDDLGQHRRKPRGPMLLTGFSAAGEPHEILGIAPDASAAEVQRAYRELMKRYHPDMVGRPGSREWADAQKIAETINEAKDALLSARRKA